jgi:tetratricopeptide (TPR) repeat protein
MNDVVMLQLTSSVFWLIIVGLIIVMFHKELRSLLRSVASLKIAGSSFEFSDKNETIKSNIILAETLIDMLSREEKIEHLKSILTAHQIEKIAAFAFKYSDEVESSKLNEEMLKNIAYLLLRFGRYEQAIKLCDVLLQRVPDHIRLLNIKALALITTRLDEKVAEALPILKSLLIRYPETGYIRLNYALANSLLLQHDEAFEHMLQLVKSEDYMRNERNPIDDPLFHRTRIQRPDLLAKLEDANVLRQEQRN